MIRRPGHLVNRTATWADDDVVAAAERAARAAGLDVALAAEVATRRGGDAMRFRSSFAQGVAAWSAAGGASATEESAAPSRGDLVALAGVAGWRSGVLDLRDDALGRIAAAGTDVRLRAAIAAALGLDAAGLGEFATRQSLDRFWWQGRDAARGYVLAAGGFAGFADAWIAPPDAWRPLDEPGAFAVRASGEWWRLDADVFGSRLGRLDAEPESSAPRGTAVVECRPDTHLAWVRVEEA
ncbi:potassium transporter Kef [Agromyces sp. MMS24-K17]|uniref:potassium transporter Kef n=1 Tax=Agromyces sp. MMS24-K17 TaxID=3372850 RepID=UPI00375494E6